MIMNIWRCNIFFTKKLLTLDILCSTVCAYKRKQNKSRPMAKVLWKMLIFTPDPLVILQYNVKIYL